MRKNQIMKVLKQIETKQKKLKHENQVLYSTGKNFHKYQLNCNYLRALDYSLQRFKRLIK